MEEKLEIRIEKKYLRIKIDIIYFDNEIWFIDYDFYGVLDIDGVLLFVEVVFYWRKC